jgi:Fe-S cluster biogenesis protein NfuA
LTFEPTIEERIKLALEEVRPFLQIDKGDVEFVRFEEELGVVELRFTGACKNCAMLPMTMRAGIERSLRASVPQIRRVEAVK